METCSREQFEKNCSKLIERFCHISFLSHPFSLSEAKAHKVIAEATEKEHLLDEAIMASNHVDSLYVYGLGLGFPYLQVKSWLNEKQERDLILIEEDLEALTTFLHSGIAQEILGHPSVHIEYFTSLEELESSLQELAEKYPVPSPLVLAIPSYEKKKNFSSLRKQILRKTTMSEAFFCDRLNAHQHFGNFLQNVKLFRSSFYANGWKGAFHNIPAIICGAGPSLDESLSALQQWQDHSLILAGGSAITALSQKGIIPHLGMAIDPNLEEWIRLKASRAFEMPILYSTRVQADIFSALNGTPGYLRSGIGGLSELWVDEELGLTDPLVGENLPQESLSVTMMSLAYAVHLGCNPIILCGVDLAYHEGKRYPKGVCEEEDAFSTGSSEKLMQHSEKKEKENLSLSEGSSKENFARDELFSIRGMNNENVLTAMRWIMERDSIATFAKNHPSTTFYNATQRGLTILPLEHKTLEEIFQKITPLQRDMRGLIHQQVVTSPLIAYQWKIEALLEEIEKSLVKCMNFTSSILAEIDLRDSPLESGRFILFQMDLKDEIAYSFLLYDVEPILDRFLARAYKRQSSEKTVAFEKWSHIQTIIESYLENFTRYKSDSL